MEKMVFEQIPELFSGVAEVFALKCEELCEMDGRMGDGDLWLTMKKGYAVLPELMRAEMAGERDIGKLLMKAGMKMTSAVPSTMGFLMSAGIMEGGKALRGRTELTGAALAEYLSGFAAGVQKRGKCEAGQRTIYDALLPAGQAAEAAIRDDPDAGVGPVIEAALKAAEDGVEMTRRMKPVFGKSAVHAAQSEGVPDQGAMAGYYMILGMRNYILGME